MNIDVTNRQAWPELLTTEHMAAIWSLSVPTINRQCSKGAFQPAPIKATSQRGEQRRWRKVDVIRFLERRAS